MTISEKEMQAYRASFQARLKRQHDQREARRRTALAAVERVAAVVIARYPSVEVAYLYGSILKAGAFHARSDIDIGVVGIAAADYFPLWHALEDALPDWDIDLRELPPESHFAAHVMQTGVKLYG